MSEISKALSAAIGNGESPTFFATDTSPPDAGNPIVRLQLATDTGAVIAAFGRTFMAAVMNGLREGSISEHRYDPASVTRDHEVDVIDLASDAALAAAVEPFSRASDARAFDRKKDGMRGFNVAAIAFRGAKTSKPVVLFKKQSQPAEIRSKRKVRIFSSKNIFDRIDAASFLFDDTFDAMSVCGKLLVFHKERFHIMFGYYDGLKQFVVEALPKLQAVVPIANFADLEAACMADKTMMKRLRRTMEMLPPEFNPVRFAAMIVKEDIPIEVSGTKAKPTFVFVKTGRHDFLTLLEDGFLKSSATDRLYEANSKRARGGAK